MELNDKIIIYTANDGQTAIDVKLENETVWLNVNQMTELFEKRLLILEVTLLCF